MILLFLLAACSSARSIIEPFENIQEVIDDGYQYIQVYFTNELACIENNMDNIHSIYFFKDEFQPTCSNGANASEYNLKKDRLPWGLQNAVQFIFQLRYYRYFDNTLNHIVGMGPAAYEEPINTLSRLSDASCDQRIQNANPFGESISDIGIYTQRSEEVVLLIWCGGHWTTLT
jgi:hypothetical protein